MALPTGSSTLADHPQESVLSVLDDADLKDDVESAPDAGTATDACASTSAIGEDTKDNGAEKSTSAVSVDKSVPAGSNLSRRAKKRLLRNQRMRARMEEQKLAKRMNKSASPSKQLDSVNKDYLGETTYYYEKGLRKVYPYNFTFNTYAKGRWYNRSILEVFTQEFEVSKLGNFQEAIESGRITVNGQAVKTDYKLKSFDFVENTLHRHEVPVTAEPIEIIEDSHDVLVVNKPSSIPVHPCGRYRHNSLTFILAKEHGYQNLRTSYRLDRLTSGVLIMTKTEAKNQEFHNHMKNREVQKEYVCRVDGTFPEGVTECKEPLEILTHRLGLFKVGAGGKESWTTFERLSCSGNNSIVICKPHTGRTHQIRVHLQYLGYPIVNDPLYNSDIWGPVKGKGGNYGKSEQQLVEELLADHKSEKYCKTGDVDELPNVDKPGQADNSSNLDTPGQADKSTSESVTRGETQEKTTVGESPSQGCSGTGSSTAAVDADQTCEDPPCKRLKTSDSPHSTSSVGDLADSAGVSDPQTSAANKCSDSGDLERPGFDPAKMTFDPDCMECQRNYQDPSPEDLVMYLHAYRYKGPTWEYSTALPAWARDDWQSS